MDDASVIQSAINNTPNFGVCKLMGDFTINSAIKIDAYKILDMEGAYLDNSGNSDYCIKVEYSGTYARNVNIIGGIIKGGAGSIKFTSAMDCKIIRTLILYSNIGLDLDGGDEGTWYNEFHQIDIIGCSEKGLYIHTTGAQPTNCLLYTSPSPRD